MPKHLVAAAFVVFVLLTSYGRAQPLPETAAEPISEKLSAAEEADARELVTRYCARLAATNSIGPLLDEFHTRDSVEQPRREMQNDWTAETAHNEDAEMEPGDAAILAMAAATWRRFYVGTIDLLYLIMVSYDVNGPKDGSTESFDPISPRVEAIIRYNPTLAAFLDEDLGFENLPSAPDLENLLNTLEAAEAIMREELQGKSSSLTGVDGGAGAGTHEPKITYRSRVLDREEYNRPKGTRVIEAELPIPFLLTLVREDGTLRVAAIEFMDD